MLTIMTFNIKNTYHKEIINGNVSERLNEIFEIIKEKDPDILGLQEVTKEVKNLLSHKFLDYQIVGRSRYGSGKINDEYNIIMVKKSLSIVNSVTYSLGKDINKVGSKGIFDFFPRICTYVKVKYKNKVINIYNTHLDHVFDYNRKKQLHILKNIIRPIKNEPIIIMGDLNLSRDNKGLKSFLENDYINITDKLVTPTFRNKYIDHIIINNKLLFKKFYIDYREKYPSDHFPIIAKIDLK